MDFLLVININLHPISHRFQVIADYWAKFMLSTGGVLLFNTLVRGEPPKLTITKFGLKKSERSLYCTVQNAFRYLHHRLFVQKQR